MEIYKCIFRAVQVILLFSVLMRNPKDILDEKLCLIGRGINTRVVEAVMAKCELIYLYYIKSSLRTH